MKLFDKRTEDRYGTVFMKEVVEYASGDYQKASILGITTGKHAFIVFDYDNLDHCSDCQVLGFQIRRSIRPVFVPARSVHSTVDRWKRENELWQLSFPRQGQLKSASKHSLPADSLTSTSANDLETAKDTPEKVSM
ncbi:MAG: hypothetical protein M1814_001267 [Vezdaea aestivalis]|nr:MAG: hypothetical protein M1814_001267 [Vezdaea aestivalis]